MSKEKSGWRDELHFNEFFHKIQAIFQNVLTKYNLSPHHIGLCAQLYMLYLLSVIFVAFFFL